MECRQILSTELFDKKKNSFLILFTLAFKKYKVSGLLLKFFKNRDFRHKFFFKIFFEGYHAAVSTIRKVKNNVSQVVIGEV